MISLVSLTRLIESARPIFDKIERVNNENSINNDKLKKQKQINTRK